MVAPLDLERTLRSNVRLVEPGGLIAAAMAGIDMAAWDVLAKTVGLPLSRLLGARERPIPVYAGIGRGTSERMAADAEQAAGAGFRAIIEHSLHEEFLADFGLSREDVAATPFALTNLAYTSYLLATAYGGSFADALGAVLP